MNSKKTKHVLSHKTKPYCLRSSNMSHFEKTLLDIAINLDKEGFIQNKVTPCFHNSTRSDRIYRKAKQYSRQKSISSEVTRYSLCSKSSYRRKGKTSHKNNVLKKNEQQISFLEDKSNILFTFNQYKENELCLGNVKELPQISWMKVDNDVMSDDNDIENGKKILMDELEKTMNYIKEDKKYLRLNIRRMRMKKKGKYSLD